MRQFVLYGFTLFLTVGKTVYGRNFMLFDVGAPGLTTDSATILTAAREDAAVAYDPLQLDSE